MPPLPPEDVHSVNLPYLAFVLATYPDVPRDALARRLGVTVNDLARAEAVGAEPGPPASSNQPSTFVRTYEERNRTVTLECLPPEQLARHLPLSGLTRQAAIDTVRMLNDPEVEYNATLQYQGWVCPDGQYVVATARRDAALLARVPAPSLRRLVRAPRVHTSDFLSVPFPDLPALQQAARQYHTRERGYPMQVLMADGTLRLSPPVEAQANLELVTPQRAVLAYHTGERLITVNRVAAAWEVINPLRRPPHTIQDDRPERPALTFPARRRSRTRQRFRD